MSTSPESRSTAPETEAQPSFRRGNRRVAMAVVLLIHLALLATVLLSRVRKPESPLPRAVDVVILDEKTTEKKVVEAPPDIVPPTVAPPPPLAMPTLPALDIVPDAIRAPAPAPAPAPVAGPAVAPPPAAAPAKEVVSSAPPKIFEECAEGTDRRMIADVYRLSVGNRSVSEIRHRKPIKRVCMAQLDITPRSFKEGFPGLGSTNEWFGLDIRFTVNIQETATYELMLLADDGAILSVDDENVIDNDGIHAPTPVATMLKLEKGLHNFRVRYFQGPGPDLALMLAWKRPGASDFGYIPRSLIGRPPAGLLQPILAKE